MTCGTCHALSTHSGPHIRLVKAYQLEAEGTSSCCQPRQVAQAQHPICKRYPNDAYQMRTVQLLYWTDSSADALHCMTGMAEAHSLTMCQEQHKDSTPKLADQDRHNHTSEGQSHTSAQPSSAENEECKYMMRSREKEHHGVAGGAFAHITKGGG